MQFTFIGNPLDARDSKGSVVVYGTNFPLNIPVDVTEPKVIAKLLHNAHFACVDGGKTYHQIPAAGLIIPKDVAEKAEKARLITMAEQIGATVDKRWNIEKITAAIEAKASEDGMAFDVTRGRGE